MPSDPPPADPAFATGEEERYRLGGTLGIGGMGHVRVAFDRRLLREVAFKEVRQEVHGELASRLAREARITAHLEHPGIVPVYDAGRTGDGRLFYTMRLVRGRSLEAVLAEGGDAAARRGLLRACLALCETVAYAHASGVVHRDLKPANVMVGPFGEVQVVDWGLARGRDEDDEVARGWSGETDLTVVGSVVGTPGYMSPEQARGERATERSDVWSLGVVLLEVLGGAPPYGRGASAVALAARAAPFEVSAPDAPPDLVAVIARALASDPGDRYADASALAGELQAWLDGRRVEAYRYSPRELLGQLVHAWRTPLAAIGAVGLALGIGGALAVDRVRDERDRARASEQAAEAALLEASAALSRERAGQAREAAHRGERAQAERLAVSSLEGAESPEARGVLARFAAVPPPLRAEPVPLPVCRERIFDAGARALLCLEGGATSLWEVGAAAPRWTVPLAATDGAHVGPLGRVVLVVGRRFHVLDAADGRALYVPDAEVPNDVGVLAASSDRHVALLTVRLVEVDAATGAVSERDPCDGAEPARIAAVDRPGERVAVLCGADEVRVGPVAGPATSTWRLGLDDGLNGPNAVAFLSDPDRLLVGLGDGRLGQRELSTGAVVGPDAMGGSAIRWLLPSEGSRVAVGRERGGPGVYDARAGAWEERLPAGRVVAMDGPDVFTAGDALVAWRLPAGRGVSEVSAPVGLTAAVPSPDGRRLGLTGGGGYVALVDPADGAAVVAGSRVPWVVKHGAFTPDGATFLTAVSGWPGLQAVDAATGRREPVPGSKNSRRVAFVGRSPVVLPYLPGPHVWDPELTAVRPERLVPGVRFHDLDARGETAVLLDVDGGVWRLDGADDLAPRRVFAAPGATAVALAGAEIVVASPRRVAVHRGDGVEVRAWAHTGELVADLAVSPDLRWVATADQDGAIRVFEAATGRLASVYDAHGQRASSVAFEPGGVLVSAGWDGRAVRHGLRALDLPVAELRAAVDAAWGPTP